jgi:hypothetical protein
MSDVDFRTKAGKALKSKESLPSNPKFFEEAPKPEDPDVVEMPRAVRQGNFSGECRRFVIHKVPNHSEWAYASPGTLTPIHIQRGKEVVLPEEYFECFTSNGREVLMCDMSDPFRDPEYYTEFRTEYPFQDMGAATWEDYQKFKAGNAKKDHPNKARKR